MNDSNYLSVQSHLVCLKTA